MRITMTFFTTRSCVKVLPGLVLLLAFVLAGCGAEPTATAPAATTAPTEPPEPTKVAAATATTAPTELPPTETPTKAPTEPPPTATATAAPTEEPTPEPIDDSGCITCHTSAETLQVMATEPEAPEVESEGEG